MKILHLLLILSLHTIFAQKPCAYVQNGTDSIGTYKMTKEYLISEKHFADNSSYVFLNLAITDNIPTLNMQTIQKSKHFIPANCLDKNSKVYLQLQNGGIITLQHLNQENCSTLIQDDKGYNNRVLNGVFLFTKENIQDLLASPVSFIRIRFLTESKDYVIPKQLTSELDNTLYTPETYFIDHLHCIK
ncbi:hypothetical protein [Flavobacterium crassostreae]|uniref:Uncharacterized protein n=1 Tax=Flavobacterium crassostreae TaxID=1763534 RepID=A0A1B9DYX4_9FLAO|nr:hypothetical protein [Flavobacterium crassostreae]OCB74884.1 hypothetical protein LPBF_09750 [Flavobacterium crassostreae]